MNKVFGNIEYDSKKQELYLEFENAEIVYHGVEAKTMLIKLVGGINNAKSIFGSDKF